MTPAPRSVAVRAASPAVLCAAALFISGCLVGPNFQTPQVAMPDGWDGPATRPTTRASVTTTQPAQTATWWSNLQDPVLNSLVTRAIESNLDLQQATWRVRQARAARGVAASALFPTVNTGASYRRSGTGQHSSNSSILGTTSSGEGHDLFQAGLDAAWELDIFGGVRRSVEAADANIVAAVEDRRDVMVSMAAEVARSYIDLRGFQQQLVIAERNLVAQQRSLDLTQKQLQAGFATGVDLANAQAQVATTQAEIPLLEAAARQAIYALSVLLGQPPGALVAELQGRGNIPLVPPKVPVGLPSDLLRRRPDIRRAEAQAHAATANIGVATADLFPKFTLTGSFGFSSSKAASLFDWSSRTWSFGPAMSWPLFDAGRIRSNIRLQTAQQEQTLLAYRATVLRAIQDVENALVAYAREQQHREALVESVTANRRAVQLSTQLFANGQTSFLNVLIAQRALLTAEDALVRSEHDIALDLVALYKALGGGWEILPEVADVK